MSFTQVEMITQGVRLDLSIQGIVFALWCDSTPHLVWTKMRLEQLSFFLLDSLTVTHKWMAA